MKKRLWFRRIKAFVEPAPVRWPRHESIRCGVVVRGNRYIILMATDPWLGSAR